MGGCGQPGRDWRLRHATPYMAPVPPTPAPTGPAVIGCHDRPPEHVAPVAPRALDGDTTRRCYAAPLAARVGGPIKAQLGQQLAVAAGRSPAAARQYLPALIGGGDREVPHEYRCSERDGDPGNVDIAPLPSAPVQAVHHVAIEIRDRAGTAA